MADKILREKRKEFVESVSQGTINGLLDELLKQQVLCQEEMELVRAGYATDIAKARALIDNVIRKGPAASEIYINYIRVCDSYLATKLGLSSGSNSGISTIQGTSALTAALPASLTVQQKDSDGSIGPATTLRLCPLDRVRELQQLKIYPMKEKSSQRTRLALIICNTEFEHLSGRSGADLDVKGMTELLQDLGYGVEVRQNLTSSDMVTELKAFAARPEHRNSDSTFVVFMSHGIREGICGKRHSEEVPDILNVDQIFQSLNAVNCPHLKDKPKVIIIQACRGVREGAVWVKDSAEDSGESPLLLLDDLEDDAIRKVHKEKDFIAFCSSTPDNVSWRHPEKGSIFIIKLIEYIKEYAWSCHLEDIFREVRSSFDQAVGRLQMPTTERLTLTKCFYLFPGY